MADSKRPGLTGAPTGRRTFSTAFRGFDQEEVRAYLEALAVEFRELRERIAELEGELETERARPVAIEGPKLDVVSITNALGEETARVLRTAQEAAEDLRTRAEEGAARTLHDAHEEASRVRAAAETVLGERTAEAEETATQIRTDAEEAARTLRAEAAAEAEATIAKAIEQGRDMLAQAQAARERVLTDLARRRKVGLSQVEQLRAGRDRLNTSLLGARGELDRIIDDLARSDEEARLAELAVGPVPSRHGEEPSLGDSGAKDVAAARDDRPAPDRAETEAEAGAPAEATEATPAAADTGAGAADTSGAKPETKGGTKAATKAAEERTDEPVDETAEEVGAVEAGAAAPVNDVAGTPDEGTADAVEIGGTGQQGDGEEGVATAPRPRSPKSRARTPYRHDRVPAGLLPAEAVGGPADEDRPSGRVDELFAKIRADRAQKVTEARAVLAEEPEAGAAEPPPARGREDPGLEAPRTDADESFLQQRDALLEEPLAAVVRAVKRGLADEQNVALERLRTTRTAAVTVDALFGDESEHRARAAGWGATGLATCSTAGSRLAGGAGTAISEELLAPAVARLGEQLTAPVRHRVADLLAGAGGDHGPDTADRVNSIYREARGRVERLVGDAVTEVVASAFAATLAAGTPVRWVVDDIDGPCPDCDDNALAGPTPLGEPFPTGQVAPPAHPGCRCVLAPSPT